VVAKTVAIAGNICRAWKVETDERDAWSFSTNTDHPATKGFAAEKGYEPSSPSYKSQNK
jgi:hypothetical protein